MPYARRFIISGTVQGVCYRASTQEKAHALGLTGWVKNLPDGNVEAFAQGSMDALDDFEGWLWEGPRHATVNQVNVKPAAPETGNGFSIKQ